MVNGKYGFAVIGYGGMGSYHCRRVRDDLAQHAVVAGIYDINPERGKVAEENGFHSYKTREELLSDETIDLVTVATPNDYHMEIVIDALNHGKNVISEKPVALSGEELEKMICAAEKNGKLFTVHQNRRWDEDYLAIKKTFDNNTLGNVFRIESRVQGSRGIPGDWRNRPEHGGGMVYDWGIHLLDQALMMTMPRKLKTVYAELTNVTNEMCDDGFRTTLIFDDGLSFYVEVTTSNFISLPRWYMLGENGSAVLPDWKSVGKIVMVSDWENRDAVPIIAGAGITKTMAPRTDETIKEYPLPIADTNWTGYYKNIFAVLDGKEKPIVTHNQQRRLMHLVETIFESGAKNKVIEFDDNL
ncbi:MAG: Gfo/Idh/MocA family oxidoreductase [Clostridiales bacterium]|nr:Gfo/Idh/MocA family oxidoreductase [Clostridiales bacterium]